MKRRPSRSLALTIAVSAAVLSTGPAICQQLDEELSLEQVTQVYLRMSDAKVLAIASEPNGAYAWGMGYEQPSVQSAAERAMAECQASANDRAVEAPCIVVMIGDSLLATPSSDAVPAAAETPDATTTETPDIVGYSEQWVGGRRFVVGHSRDLQVWVAPALGPKRALFVYVVNASDRAITFEPTGIRASVAEGHPKAGKPVEVWSAEEFERKERAKAGLAAGLMAASAAMANQPQPTTSTYSGTYRSYGAGYGWGSFHGTITTWPTAADYTAANLRTQAQVAAMGSQLRAGLDAMAATLMRTHTMMPQTYYGGIAHLRRFPGRKVTASEEGSRWTEDRLRECVSTWTHNTCTLDMA